MQQGELSPAQLRHVFGANLRSLATSAPSISQLCRDLGINRTQFNRYLNAEAFPRPDVLHRICVYFNVDARILLQPIESLQDPSLHPGAISDYSTMLCRIGALSVPQDLFPDGAYLHRTLSYLSPGAIHCALFRVSRDERGTTHIRGFMPAEASVQIGLERKPAERRFRGLVFRQLRGCSFVSSMAHAPVMAVGGFEPNYMGLPNFYSGSSISTQDVQTPAPLLLERLEPSSTALLAARRELGLKEKSDLSPFLRSYFDRYRSLR